MSKSIIQNFSTVLFNNAVTFTTSASHFIPRGTVWTFHGSNAPAGWNLCDGSGTYVAENGTITDIPDLRGRFILGAGTGTNLTQRTLNDVSGHETHTLTVSEMPTHNHNSLNSTDVSGYVDASGGHTHTYNNNTSSNVGLAKIEGNNTWPGDPPLDTTLGEVNLTSVQNLSIDSAGQHQHKIYSAGGNTAHSIMNPFYVLTYIIKV